MKHGFRLVIGSWKIIATSRPVIARRWRGESFIKSWPANAMRSALTVPLAATSPITARDDTLLPEPDSPTMPTTSPSSTVRSMPSTARTTPPWVAKSTLRLRMSNRGMASSV